MHCVMQIVASLAAEQIRTVRRKQGELGDWRAGLCAGRRSCPGLSRVLKTAMGADGLRAVPTVLQWTVAGFFCPLCRAVPIAAVSLPTSYPRGV